MPIDSSAEFIEMVCLYTSYLSRLLIDLLRRSVGITIGLSDTRVFHAIGICFHIPPLDI
jgi:hypothetical protein